MYKGFFVYFFHFFYLIFSFWCFTPILEWFRIYELYGPTSSSIFGSFFTLVMFSDSPIEISSNTSVECAICTTEYVEEICGHYYFRFKSLNGLVKPLIISQSILVSSFRNATRAILAFPSVGVARSRIFMVQSGRVVMYSFFWDPGMTLTRIVSGRWVGNCIDKTISKIWMKAKYNISKILILTIKILCI